MDSWHSYPSIYNLGHRYIAELLTVPVNVEEKVEGSQFSMGVTESGEVKVRSKGCELYPDAPEEMFARAVETAKELAPLMRPGWTYRGEYLQKPKHNALAYSRTPAKHVILFDVNTGLECYLPYAEKAAEAARLGLEVVPLLYSGMVTTADQLRAILDTESILGGQKIEGVVIKPVQYQLFGMDKKALLGKFVSEAYKETATKDWKKQNPGSGDILDVMALTYRTEARWRKAVQHLRESGQLTDSPKDIGKLIAEAGSDIHRECADEIKSALFKWAWPHIQRKAIAGLPEWYKQQLMDSQFAVADAVEAELKEKS